MLENIRRLLNDVSIGQSNWEAIDTEFERLVLNGDDQDILNGVRLMEDFLFAQAQLGFQEENEAA